MRQRQHLDPANVCSHCPHQVWRLNSGTLWCPCEDCHTGGLVQGREPKAEFDRPSTIPLDANPDVDDDGLWVDPIHSL